MEEKRKLDRTGAYDWEALMDEWQELPPDEFSNPPGIGRGACDTPQSEENPAADATAAAQGSCDIEIKAEVEDLFLEETKPGFGIPGFEGEEDGGG